MKDDKLSPAEHARALADLLGKTEEIVLGPTDQAVMAAALQFYAPHLATDPAA